MWLFVFLNPYLTVEAPTLFLHVWPLSAPPPPLQSFAVVGVAVTLMWQWKYLLRFCVCVFRKALQARKQDNRESSVINYSN